MSKFNRGNVEYLMYLCIFILIAIALLGGVISIFIPEVVAATSVISFILVVVILILYFIVRNGF